MVRRFVEDDASKAGLPNRANERSVLEKLRKELDSARMKVDEAALRLKDEKDGLEVSICHDQISKVCIHRIPGRKTGLLSREALMEVTNGHFT